MDLISNKSIFSNLGTSQGATLLTIFMLVIFCVSVMMYLTNFNLIELVRFIIKLLAKLFGKFINKQEEIYHRDIEIGRITEKRVRVKLYRFLSDLIIDLGMLNSGITPYELLAITLLITNTVVLVVCKILFGTFLVAIGFGPIVTVGVFCVMYTKANIAHDTRIESVIEAENIICNNIKIGVVAAVRDSLDVIPKTVRPDFKDFLDNVEQKNYHIKTALLELNKRLGNIADEFIKKCIVFEMEEEHGIAGMFQDVVEINNIKTEMRTEMKRRFEEVKYDFILGAGMIFAFLGIVLALYPTVRSFYLHKFIGQFILGLDALLLIAEFVFITYLRAQEL